MPGGGGVERPLLLVFVLWVGDDVVAGAVAIGAGSWWSSAEVSVWFEIIRRLLSELYSGL